MKIVRVLYTTTKEYAEINKRNIQSIVKELEKINHKGIKYNAYVLPDGKSLMHLVHFENEEAHEFLNSLQSFKKFSDELWASSMEVEPKLELLDLVAGTLKLI
jgi:hypothetical protein